MVTISIIKNNKVIKEFQCNPKQLQSVYQRAIDIAGGMWNGVDKISVKVS